MFKIINLCENKEVVAYNTKEAVVFFFLQHSSYRIDYPWKPLEHWDMDKLFRQLNITGHDTYRNDFVYQSSQFDQRYNPGFVAEALRPYQVVDDEGKICDPRNWLDEIKKVLGSEKPYLFNEKKAPSFPEYIPGSKISHRSMKMPAMHHRNLRLSQSEVGEEHYSENSGMRIKGLDTSDGYDRAEKKYFKTPPKSWKEHTKNPAQWGKHKNSCSSETIRRPEDKPEDPEEFDDVI